MKGGSKASDLVMESKPVLCDKPTSVVNVGPKMDFDIKQISGYKTTGGFRKTVEEIKKVKQNSENIVKD